MRVPCRDQAGHRGHLEVTAVDNGVVLRTPDAGLVHLTPLHIGRLRAALRDAVLAPPPDERHP
ncbi:hypothetical protein CLV40_10137 [Actinokineospora auranticolor]|uniref:Uncharacterized protein n=1 Tax=Actinokineospora auranticolor TaxID=155976 RepID=A0A2S6H097_9PSEU|nr:hypothetical protein CLV40_10137 [Actinokineospora auranticolor]